MYGYIYKTVNNSNGKLYIGKHKKSYFDSTYHGSGVILREAINKYGADAFTTELIECCEDLETLNAREKYWITFYQSRDADKGYNIAPGGDGGVVWKDGHHPSLGVRRSGSDNPFYGKHHTEESKNKQRNTWKQKIASGYVSPAKDATSKLKDSILVRKADSVLRIKRCELEHYEALGWKYPYKRYIPVMWGMTGKQQSDYQKQRAHETHKGKQVTDAQVERFKETMSSKTATELALISKRKSDALKGRIWVTDGTNNKLIDVEAFQEYEYFGFYWGRTAR